MTMVAGSPTPVPLPFASLGIMKVSSQGSYTAYGTISIGGQVQDTSLTGSIQVNPDCTGTDTYNIGPFQGSDRLVVLDNGNEMHMMPTVHPLGPVAGRAYFRRIAWGEPNCTTDMVRGVYGGSGAGIMMIPLPGQPQPAPMPFSALFAMTFERVGTGTGTAAASVGGTVFSSKFPNTTLVVNPDCTATLEWTGVSSLSPGETHTGAVKYIVLDHGNELMGLSVKDSAALPIEIENLKRISMQ